MIAPLEQPRRPLRERTRGRDMRFGTRLPVESPLKIDSSRSEPVLGERSSRHWATCRHFARTRLRRRAEPRRIAHRLRPRLLDGNLCPNGQTDGTRADPPRTIADHSRPYGQTGKHWRHWTSPPRPALAASDEQSAVDSRTTTRPRPETIAQDHPPRTVVPLRYVWIGGPTQAGDSCFDHEPQRCPLYRGQRITHSRGNPGRTAPPRTASTCARKALRLPMPPTLPRFSTVSPHTWPRPVRRPT